MISTFRMAALTAVYLGSGMGWALAEDSGAVIRPVAKTPDPAPVTVQLPAAESFRAAGVINPDLACPNGIVPKAEIIGMIRREAARQGADVKLALAVAERESQYGQQNNSSAGARGPMQLTPGTATAYGVRDICDPGQNIQGGVSYLRDLNKEFGGNIYLILAAYNAGPASVYKAGGVPAIAETVNYVARVSNVYFGFPNRLSRKGKIRTSEGPVVVTASSEEAGAQVTAQDLGEKAKPPAGDRWIGGSVLYVGD